MKIFLTLGTMNGSQEGEYFLANGDRVTYYGIEAEDDQGRFTVARHTLWMPDQDATERALIEEIEADPIPGLEREKLKVLKVSERRNNTELELEPTAQFTFRDSQMPYVMEFSSNANEDHPNAMHQRRFEIEIRES